MSEGSLLKKFLRYNVCTVIRDVHSYVILLFCKFSKDLSDLFGFLIYCKSLL